MSFTRRAPSNQQGHHPDEWSLSFCRLCVQKRPCSPGFQRTWGLRDLLAIKYTPACITVVAHDSGRLLWQNAASMAMFGEGWLDTWGLVPPPAEPEEHCT